MALVAPMSSYYRRCIAIVLVVVLASPFALAARAPPQEAGSSEPPVLGAAALAGGVPPDAVRSVGALGWELIEGAARTTYQAVAGDDLATGELRLRVDGIPVFGFVARHEGGTLRVLVDGVPVRIASFGLNDLRLDGGAHTLAWTFEPASPGANVLLELAGALSIVPPVATVPLRLVGCLVSELPLQILSTLPIPLDRIRTLVDGVPASIEPRVTTDRGDRVETSYAIPLAQAEGTGEHRVLVEFSLPTGEVLTLLDQLLKVEILSGVTVFAPSGWTYDLRPTISLVSVCALDPVVDVTLSVDGQDVTDRMTRSLPIAASFGFSEDIPFREEHAYVLDIRLAGGRSYHFEETFIEGLDVDEFDVGAGTLTLQWVEAPSIPVSGKVGKIVSGASPGWIFFEPEQPLDLPPVHVRNMPGLEATIMPLATRAHLRAVYAPLELVCTELACSPFGGQAPGFYAEAGPLATTLTATLEDGTVLQAPVLGQFAAASHHSHVEPVQALVQAVKAPRSLL